MKEKTSFWICSLGLIVIFAILPSMSHALTTFGKTNPQNQNQNPPPPPTPVWCDEVAYLTRGSCIRVPRARRSRVHTNVLNAEVGKARECRMESDCAGIQNTTCLADQRDGRTRCLCGDYNAPVNGACTNKYKAIRAPCNDDSECIEGAHCVVKLNSTTSGKRCYCREGYVEDNLMCSGSSSILTNISWILFPVLTVFLGRINYL